jgi:hypothetical protein
MSAPIPVMATPLDTCVDCVGWIIVTAITDNYGQISYHHSSIYRSEAEATEICARYMPREPRIWERSIARTVQRCRTCFPLSDVLAGRAERWDADELDQAA